jgi:signal transduction histidine kinase
LIHIAESFEYSNSDSTLYYAEIALQLAKNSQNIPAQMGAMSFMAYALLRQGNLPKALELSLEAIKLGEYLPVRIAGGIGPVYSVLGELYLEIGDYDKARQYFQKMTALGEGDIVGVAYGQYYLAMIYEKLNQLDSADFYLHQSYETFGTLNYSYYPDVYNVYPPWYNLRAKFYLKQNKPDLAINDLYTSLQMTMGNGDIFHVSNTCIDISNYFENVNQTDSAMYYAEMGNRQANKINYTQGILKATEILARLNETRDPTKALHYFKLAQETRDKLYGAGNIQILRDMIAQEEKRQAEIEATEKAFQNRLMLNTILGIAFTLFGFAVFLFIIFKRKQKAKQKIESAYNQLKSTQAQLIQSEKMASLGELTAGIAHEIQNPLNFVNNFSEVNQELIEELEDELNAGNINDVLEISKDIKENEQKINHHGKRADAIVKGMLQHSRTTTNEKEATNINALADEYLRLAYHGLRAKDKSFNADFKTDFDETLPKVNIIPQDIGRVLLNLIHNAFYAVKDKTLTGFESYKPLVTLTTLNLGDSIEIRVKDNGSGIPDSIKDKIFQPFFTTKPTGQGTGLGLSLSYDIVKAHGGELKVETLTDGQPGTEFIIQLPK